MEHKIIELDEFDVVGLQIKTSVEECQKDNKMPELWENFISRADEIKHRDGENFYGVSITESKSDCTFKSLASVKVNSTEDIPEGMVLQKVPKAKYAVYTHKGTLADLNTTYGAIMQDLEKKNLQENDIWLEVYDDRWKGDVEDSEMDIYVSIN